MSTAAGVSSTSPSASVDAMLAASGMTSPSSSSSSSSSGGCSGGLGKQKKKKKKNKKNRQKEVSAAHYQHICGAGVETEAEAGCGTTRILGGDEGDGGDGGVFNISLHAVDGSMDHAAPTECGEAPTVSSLREDAWTSSALSRTTGPAAGHTQTPSSSSPPRTPHRGGGSGSIAAASPPPSAPGVVGSSGSVLPSWEDNNDELDRFRAGEVVVTASSTFSSNASNASSSVGGSPGRRIRSAAHAGGGGGGGGGGSVSGSTGGGGGSIAGSGSIVGCGSVRSGFSRPPPSAASAAMGTPLSQRNVADTSFLSPPPSTGQNGGSGVAGGVGGGSPYSPTNPSVMASIFADAAAGGALMNDGDDDENVSNHSGGGGGRAPSVHRMNGPVLGNHAASEMGIGESYRDEIRSCVLELQGQMEEKFAGVLAAQRRDFDRVYSMLQSEAARQSALNSRLHAQLLLQSESMVAMELKVLRLEARMEKRDRDRGRASSRGGRASQYNPHSGGGIMGGIDRVDEEDVPLSIPVVNTHHHRSHHHQHHHRSRHDSMESEERPAVVDTPTIVHSRNLSGTGGGRPSPTNLIGAAFVGSSGASLASGVTATSGEGFMDEEGTVDDEDDENAADADAEDDAGATTNDDDSTESSQEDVPANESDSTPTQGSRHSSQRIVSLDSALQRAICADTSHLSDTAVSTRAVRPPPDADGASSLATSVTSATLTSTVVTATTRGSAARTHASTHGGSTLGDDNENVVALNRGGGGVGSGALARDGENPVIGIIGGGSSNRARQENIEMVFGMSPRVPGASGGGIGSTRGGRGAGGSSVAGGGNHNEPRSRSQSPLTVQDSVAQESVAQESVASASVANSSVGIASTAAVAPSRAFTTRRAAAAAAAAAHHASTGGGDPNRPLTNRVVQFVSNPTIENFSVVSEGGDSLTIPDELDNLSDVADVFATSSRRWREDYEARLDAIQKRFATE